MALPRYVEYGGLVCCPTPFACKNTTLDGFWVKADGQKLDELCHRVFYEPTGGAVEYVALGDYIMLAWGRIESAESKWHEPARPAGVPWNERGGVAEPQVCVWVPAAQVKHTNGQRRAHKFVWFMPYIWVDNAMSLATGRETLGYPKTFGRFGFPAEGDNSLEWSVEAFGLEHYGPGQKADYVPMMEVKQTGGFGETLDEDFENLGDLALSLGQLVHGTTDPGAVRPDLSFATGLFQDLWEKQMHEVFLKQIRSAEDGLGAALQQVVEADYDITDFKGLPYPHLNQFELTVHQVDSHPVMEDLGLPATQTVRAAYHVVMSFDVVNGHVAWSSGAA